MELREGDEIRGAARTMTRERMRWYADMLPTVRVNDGRVHFPPPTIHDDDDYARAQGLPGIIADGMLSTNWILDLMLRSFGDAALQSVGTLMTKYIGQVPEDMAVACVLRVEGVQALPDGKRRLALKVWAEDGAGRPVTVGTAAVTLAAG